MKPLGKLLPVVRPTQQGSPIGTLLYGVAWYVLAVTAGGLAGESIGHHAFAGSASVAALVASLRAFTLMSRWVDG